MSVSFLAMPTKEARAFQRGEPDANGQVPERRISDGETIPCRHCLRLVPRGAPYLVLAYRPFRSVQPYAEVGPIFLCARECSSGSTDAALPPLLVSDRYIVRGYDADERIVYGSGRVKPTAEITAYSEQLLRRADIAFVHVRSATNNCYQLRVERSGQLAQ